MTPTQTLEPLESVLLKNVVLTRTLTQNVQSQEHQPKVSQVGSVSLFLSFCPHSLVLSSLPVTSMTDIRREPIPTHLVALLEALRPDGSLVVADSPSCRVPPCSQLSEAEARFYYAGLPSAPILVGRSGSDTRWKVPTSPDTYQKLQEFRASLDKPFDQDWDADVASKRKALLDSIKLKRLYRSASHPLMKVWEGYLRPNVCIFLDGLGLKWNSVDPFYIGSEDRFIPVLLIGVVPGSLDGHFGGIVSHVCRKFLFEEGFTDVDVEIREWIDS